MPKTKSPKKKSRTVLITGGAGFIGSNTLIYLFEKYPHYHFIVLDSLTYAGDVRSIPQEIYQSKNFRFFYGDVRSHKLIDDLVGVSDIVVHFAAETHVARSIYDDTTFFETDILGTQNIIRAVVKNRKRIERFIHFSTSEVYGTALADKMDENHPLNPQSPYAAAKAGADRLVYAYFATYHIPAVSIRSFNVFGPRQHLEKAIPRFISAMILGEPITIHGTGDSERDFIYVTDVARAVDLVMHAPAEKVVGEVFNIGTGKSVAIKDLAAMVVQNMQDDADGKSKTKFSSYAYNIGDRPGQVFRHTADVRKIAKTLKWKPLVSFEDGLRKTIAWYQENTDWWKNKLWMRHVEIETESGKKELH